MKSLVSVKPNPMPSIITAFAFMARHARHVESHYEHPGQSGAQHVVLTQIKPRHRHDTEVS
jgi:hypothetical protein